MLKKAGTLLLICASVAAWVSCGKSTNHYLYAAINASNEIYVFREDPNSGILTQLSFSPVGAGIGVNSMVIHPSNKYLYASNSGEGDVSLFTTSTDGALNEVLPRTQVGVDPTAMAMDAAGAYLYVVNAGSETVSVLSIDSGSGALTPVANQLTQSNQYVVGFPPTSIAIDPSGTVLYVTGQGSLGGALEAFSITTGQLSLIGQSQTGNVPSSVVVSPNASNGSNIYTANTTDHSISEFTAVGGVLTPVAGSPIGESQLSPLSLFVSKSGGFLCVANSGSNNVAVYAIGSDGSLSVITTSPFASNAQPSFITGDPNGEYVFVGNQSGPSVQSFALNASSGALTVIASYKLPGTPTSIAIMP